MSAATVATNGRGRARVPRDLAAASEPEQKGPRLMEALLAVQTEAPKLVRTATGQIQNRTYRYVTLDSLLDVVLPILLAHQLVWVTLPTRDDHGEPALRYRLTHTPSEEILEDVMPLMCARPDPQGQGSAITYARRYALMAVLNLAPDEDDDGAAASSAYTAGIPAADARAPQRERPESGGRPATVKQRGMLRKKAEAAKLSESEFADVLLVATGNEPRGMAEPSAERWLKMGLDRLPAAAVDAVIAGIAHAAAEGSQA